MPRAPRNLNPALVANYHSPYITNWLLISFGGHGTRIFWDTQTIPIVRVGYDAHDHLIEISIGQSDSRSSQVTKFSTCFISERCNSYTPSNQPDTDLTSIWQSQTSANRRTWLVHTPEFKPISGQSSEIAWSWSELGICNLWSYILWGAKLYIFNQKDL